MRSFKLKKHKKSRNIRKICKNCINYNDGVCIYRHIVISKSIATICKDFKQ